MAFEKKNKTFYIRNAMAYTEDNLRVHKLFLGNIPSDVEDEEVLAYFRRYGNVLEMQLTTDSQQKHKRRKCLKSGHILFANASVATKVLLKEKHLLHMKQILVTACYSWNQPDAYKSTKDSVKAADNSGAPEALNILNLNDDCLELIAKKLDLRAQVRMALSCKRFSGILEMRSKVQHKTISLKDFAGLTLWEIREFFLVAGNAVENISGELPYQYKERVIELIAENCPNVKRIELNNSVIQTSSMLKLCANLKNITELHLRNCSLADNAFMSIQKLAKLEVLALPDNYNITGKHLSQLTNLRELDLQGCCNIQTTHFVEIIKSTKNLKSLNIKNCPRLLSRAFEEMENHCLQLESLRMSMVDIPYIRVLRLPALKRLEVIANNIIVNESLFAALSEQPSQLEYLNITAWNCINMERAIPIAQQKTLKHLVLARNENLTDDCLDKFCALEQLEEIDLRGCTNITNVGLLKLVRLCTELRRVNIQRCPNIDDGFVLGAIRLLRERRRILPAKQRMELLTLEVFNTGISETIINDSNNQSAASLIKLSFHCKLMEESDFCDAEDYDEYNEVESSDDEGILEVVDVDRHLELYHEHHYSDLDDDDFHEAYNRFAC